MIRNYFKIAFRNLAKNKLYAFINLFGLTLGITCCILIGAYIFDELGYDKFHVRADRIVRTSMEYSTGGSVEKYAMVGTKAGPQFKRTFPEVEDYVRVMKYPRVIGYGDKLFTEENFLYADTSFFKIFSFAFVEGNSAGALNRNDKIVLSQSAAKKYFGKEEALGKVLKVNDKNFSVSAITEDVPGNSQVQYDYVIAYNNLSAAATEQWWTANNITYLLLRDKEDIVKVQQKITAYMKTGEVREEYGAEGNDYLTYNLEPLTDVHLRSTLEGFEPNGSITYIYILAIIAVLILAIACANYTNLATAQAVSRNAEIGIRKVMGALRYQLFIQFICESVLIAIVAVMAALLLSTQLFPVLNTITGKQLSAFLLFGWKSLLFLFMGTGLIGFAAGAYPAILLSGSGIVKILKAGFSMSGRGLKKSLIVFQFAISVFLIIATTVIVQQISYIRSKNPGYDKEHVLALPIDSRSKLDYEGLKNEVKLLKDVNSVSGAYSSPVQVLWGDAINADNGQEKISLSINAIPVDLDFIETLGIKLAAGSDYTRADLQQLMENNSGQYAYMLNETAVKKIGWTPEQAIGKTISVGEARPGVVKAVVKDFNFQSMHEPIGPLMLFLEPQWVRNMYLKISGHHIPATLRQIQAKWEARIPYRPFEYRFLDDEFNNLYTAEQIIAKLFAVFSSIAILLACLGLFGLAAFTTVQRTKEIGVRKMLGASVSGIVALLSKDFAKLVLVASLIAFPMAWLAMTRWLQGFTYRVDISGWVFVAAASGALLIALITVSFQAIKVALANPVKSLRTE